MPRATSLAKQSSLVPSARAPKVMAAPHVAARVAGFALHHQIVSIFAKTRTGSASQCSDCPSGYTCGGDPDSLGCFTARKGGFLRGS